MEFFVLCVGGLPADSVCRLLPFRKVYQLRDELFRMSFIIE